VTNILITFVRAAHPPVVAKEFDRQRPGCFLPMCSANLIRGMRSRHIGHADSSGRFGVLRALFGGLRLRRDRTFCGCTHRKCLLRLLLFSRTPQYSQITHSLSTGALADGTPFNDAVGGTLRLRRTKCLAATGCFGGGGNEGSRDASRGDLFQERLGARGRNEESISTPFPKQR
jgi:hypothetical protein